MRRLFVLATLAVFACADDTDSGPAPDTVLDDVPPALGNARRIAITFHANGEANDFICQLDGEAPTTCSSPFERDVGEGEHTFRVSATLGTRVDETPAMHAWRVDATPPQTTLLTAPPALDNSLAPTFTFDASDPAARADGVTFECALDGAAFAACTSPHTASVGAGAHAFAVRGVDLAGNADPDPATHAWTVDTSTPDTTIVGGPADASTSGPGVSFALAASDATATFECAVDGAAFAACTSPATIAALASGSHTFTARAKTPNGAVDPTPPSRTWTVDATPPDVAITGAPATPSSDATPTFDFGSPDATATFACQLDAEAVAACRAPFTSAALADGAHAFTVHATDPYGNAATATHAWTLDATAPTVTFTNGPTGVVGSTSATFSFTVAGAVGAAECSLDGAGFTACTSPQRVANLAQGPHELSVRAADEAANVGMASRTFTVDTQPPAVAITHGPSGPTALAAPAFEFTATDATGLAVECRLDAAAFAACTSPFASTALADGPHTFVVRATDEGSNAASASRSFTVDTAPPNLTITARPADPTNDETATVAFTVVGASRVECQLDAAAPRACASPFTTLALADGPHTIVIRATDAAANAETATVAFVLDTAPPSIEITAGPSGATNDPTPAYSFVASADTTRTDCRVDAAAFAACTSAFTTSSLGDGSHVVEVRAHDAAGNTASTTRSITVDTTAPTLAITAPSTPTNDATPALTFTTTGDPSRSECRVDLDAFVPCSSPYTTPPLADGFHTIDVRVSDSAGNTASGNTSVTVDTQAPVVTVMPVATPTNVTRPPVTFTVSGAPAAQCQVDGGGFAACTSPFTPPVLADGAHTIEVRATDAAGNTAAGTTTFVVDTTPPTVAITRGGGLGIPGAQQFTFAHGADATRVECRVDTAAFAPCTSPFDTPSTTGAGTYVLDVRVADAAGNEDVASRVFDLDPIVQCLDGQADRGDDDVSGHVEQLVAATVELWFRSNGGGDMHLVDFDIPALYPNVPVVSMRFQDGAFRVAVDARHNLAQNGSLNQTAFALPGGFARTSWHHYAVVLDRAIPRVFIDGAELTAVTVLEGDPLTTFVDAFGGYAIPVAMHVGYFARDNVRYASGAFRDLRLSDVARYDAPFLPPYPTYEDSDTLLMYPMDEGAGPTSFEMMMRTDGVDWLTPSWGVCRPLADSL